mmetsp:Transcript_23240/g.64444  ORF Transcript_23240/g.64444 Transcript_23240/m.64444 type:complete len:650 (-) Transcript_23240:1517-3466(-)
MKKKTGEVFGEMEPEPMETFESDNEEDYEDDDDDDDVDDEIDEQSDVPFWKEHLVAILVAVLASVAVHFYSQNSSSPLSSLLRNSVNKHDHLEGFSRTANVSFCHQDLQQQQQQQHDRQLTSDSSKSKRLHSMDFYLPRDQFDSLLSLYTADKNEDDSYKETDASVAVAVALAGRDSNSGKEDLLASIGANANVNANVNVNPEFRCLLEQHQTSPPERKFRGTTFYYKDPTLEEIYPELLNEKIKASSMVKKSSDERKRKVQQPPLTFTGFAAKFVNLDTNPVLLYWDGKGGHEDSRKLVGEIPPMESIGTATMPGHSFHVTPIYDPARVLHHWVVTADTALVFYEPKNATELKDSLGARDDAIAYYAMYQRQMINKAFARDYTIVSGRTWLANFPRPFPLLHMHEASYIGQEHRVGGGGGEGEGEGEGDGEMTLRVASVRPRVLTIENFLTPDECREVIRLGLQQGLTESTLHSGPLASQSRDKSTRSSSNAWLSRHTSDLIDQIYERTARATNIDPELFRKLHDSSAQHHSIAESLQVVRYKTGEEYTPHHDFVAPSINNRHQPSRFATLLIYLNDVEEGGETRFPRAINNHNAEGLEIKPEVGKAVLFYNTLEDGNLDDLSQHGGNKVLAGNKWLANLWIWDPVIG